MGGKQTTTPRCAFFEGKVHPGDKVIFKLSIELGSDILDGLTRFIPGYKIQKGDQVDPMDRFEEAIHGWCILSPENPSDRSFTIKKLEGGVGHTYIKFSFTSTDSQHGDKN